jgi:AcrR family transcriptional regulator
MSHPRPVSAVPPAPAVPRAAGALSVQDHILDRTVFLVGKKGTTDVTVREIAREAHVNVAAVNYYFASKEQMFAQLAARFAGGYEEVMQLLETPGVPAEVRLRRWAETVMGHLAAYPGVLSLMERLMTADAEDPFGRALRDAMQSALRRVRATLAECLGPVSEARLDFKLTLFTSALAGPFPRLGGRPPNRSRGLRTAAARGRFLDLLLEHLRT